MTVHWQPFREPLRNTLLRTGLIALAGGAALSFWWGGIARWPVAFLIVLWFSLGGHFVELFFLNFLRPRLRAARPVQVAARLAVWFTGGTLLALGMIATAALANANVARGLALTWWG